MRRIGTKLLAAVAALALTLTCIPAQGAQAAGAWGKKIKLSPATVKVKAKKTKKVKIKNSSGKKITKVKWSVKKGASVVKLTGKKKTGVTIQGKKKGTAVVSAKITTKAGSVTKQVNVTVTKASTGGSADDPAKDSDDTDTIQKQEAGELIHYDMSCSEDGKTLLDKSGRGNDAKLVNVSSEKQQNDSLFVGNGGYIELPEEAFVGQDTLTISIWLKNYSGAINTSAMFVGTKESSPVSYWLLNPANLQGRMKSVITNSADASAPWSTEVGISASDASKGVDGPCTSIEWNHYVTVITPESITGYMNGEKVGSCKVQKKISDFGSKLAAYIGKSSYPDVTWTGFVREVTVTTEVKTDEQVKQMYQDTKGTETHKKGTESEIFIENRADPYITKGDDGYYYFTASYPMNGARDAEGYDRIVLRRSKTIEGLKTAEEKTVWDEKDSKSEHRFIWAPELHKIGGKWYLYYASSGSSSNPFDINCHVLMCTGDDPYTTDWEAKGKFQAASGDTVSFTNFSLDMTYFECNGKSYVIWAQKAPESNLYMAEVDPAQPWIAKTKAMLLTKPEYYWERVSIPVNEGPSVLIHDGKVIVAYSAAATGPEYCIGLLYADEKADLLDPKSWTKQSTPALTSEDLVGEYGPGHNSFTEDEDGNTIFVYHSRSQECFEGKCGYGDEDPLYDPCRSARIRKVVWDENGLPILNQ